MEFGEIIITAGSVIASLGGFELVKWLLNRKSNSRIVEANADSAELKNDIDEFHFLKERIEFKDKQLIEETEHVRQLNKQLLEQTIENGKLRAENRALRAERKMKLCEVRSCHDRKPKSGY